MKFYEVTSQIGGEDIWLRRIADLYGEEPSLIWPRGKLPLIAGKTKFNNLLLKFSIMLDKLKPGIGRGLFLNFLFAFYKLDDELILLSTTYIPIPRGRRIISYIHTPSRSMTVDYFNMKNSFKKSSVRLFLPVLRLAYRIFYKFSLPHAKVLLVNSKNVQKRVLDFTGIRTEVCYPSQDTDSFHLSESENYFLLVSKIQPYKGHDFCLRAFKIFYEKNTDFRLIIVSVSPMADDEKDFYYRLDRYAREHSLPVEFKFDLKREEVIELYSRSYLCLFGSRNEDLGQVPIEAMASSKPVISVLGAGPSETIENNVTGFLVDTEEEMAEKMLLLAGNPLLAKDMGSKGRKRSIEVFDDLRFKECLDKQLERISNRGQGI